MRKLFVLTALLMIAALTTQAAVVLWTGDSLSGGNGDYANGDSWADSEDLATPYGSPPKDTDSHGIITFLTTAIAPTISSAISEAPGTTGIGWNTWGSGELNIVDGGELDAVYVNLPFGQSGGITNVGTINMSGGTLNVSDILYFGGGNGYCIGIINQSGGLIHLNNLGLVEGLGDGAGFFLSDTAVLWIDQNFIALDLVDLGWISAPVVDQYVLTTWNATEGRTEYTVVPEPAFLGILAILGLAFLHRK